MGKGNLTCYPCPFMITFMFKLLLKTIVFLALALTLGVILSPFTNMSIYWLLQPLQWIGLPQRLLNDLRLTGRFEWVTTYFSLVPSLLITSLVMCRLEGRPLTSLGLSRRPHWLKEFTLGVMFAFIFVAPILIMLRLFNPQIPIRLPIADLITYIHTPNGWLAVSMVLALLTLFGAAFEELLFRGYLFQTMMAALGRWPTILATSGIFAVVHFATHKISAMVVVGILGLIMALLYLRGKSLWIVIGFHAGVNGLFGIAYMLRLILFKSEEVEENWLFPMTGVMALILVLWTLKYLKPSAEMEALWQRYVPVAQPWAQLKGWWARRRHAPHDRIPPES